MEHRALRLLATGAVAATLLMAPQASASPKATATTLQCDGTLYSQENPSHVVYPHPTQQAFNDEGQVVVDLSESLVGMTVFFSEANAEAYPFWEGAALINGTGFDDVICGSPEGSQEIYGRAGDDRIFGEGGPDLIYGNDGADVIYVGFSPSEAGLADPPDENHVPLETLAYGGRGSDTLWGSELSINTFRGGNGADVLYGAGNGDFLKGGKGNDTIYAGEAGDVTIRGKSGLDQLIGWSPSTPIDAAACTAGNLINGGGDSDTITVGPCGDTAKGHQGDDTIYGGFGDDTLNGNGGADTITGGEGSDTITGGVGADTLSGDTGNDVLFGTTPVARGDGQADAMTGGPGDDSFFGFCGDFDHANDAEEVGSTDTADAIDVLSGEFEVVVNVCPS